MSAAPEAPARPALRYHGGKWRLAPWIISHFPAHHVYVEPFGGAASVLLRKGRTYGEIYGEIDEEVTNFFEVLRDHGPALREKLALTPFSRAEFDRSYQPAACPVERARRLVFRSFAGFGTNSQRRAKSGSIVRTGFRGNVKRSGTTPAQDWATYPWQVGALITRLQGVVIETRPARQVMACYDGADTLHYVDPPYPLSTRNTGSDYRHEMTDADHRELAEFLRGLKGMVVLSGYACPLYAELFPGWERREKSTYADGARARVESLWLNPACASRLTVAATKH